jgi:hypothetical protein
MCLACKMEAMWFAMMEGRAAGGENAPQQPGDAMLQPDEPATLLPPPERGRVGEEVAGRTDQAGGMRGESGESEGPRPNPLPEEGGGGASVDGAPDEGAHEPLRSTPSGRFACEETSAE